MFEYLSLCPSGQAEGSGWWVNVNWQLKEIITCQHLIKRPNLSNKIKTILFKYLTELPKHCSKLSILLRFFSFAFEEYFE